MGVTATQRRAAAQLKEIAKYNGSSTSTQLRNALADLDLSDAQNRDFAEVQKTANSKQSAADRFSQLKNLQSSTKGVLASAGNALQGSQLGSLSGMIADRNDLDNAESYGTLTQNQNQVENSLTEALNSNVLQRRDAINNAAFQLRSQEAELAAQLSNIDPSLYRKPGKLNLGSKTTAARAKKVPMNKATRSGYILPDAAIQPGGGAAPQGSSYFDRLMNSYQ